MSKLPMDLSKFKKVASDKDTSTFRHYEGHEIKVAHSKLSSKMREQLDKMPTHKPKEKTEKFADGGVAGKDSPNEFDDMVSTLNPINVIKGDQAQQQVDHDAAMASLPKTPDQPPAEMQEPNAAPAEAPQTDAVASAQTMPTRTDGLIQTGDPSGLAAPVSQPPYSLQGSLQGQVGALKGQQAGESALAGAQGALGQAQAGIEKTYQDQAQKSMDDQATAMKPFMEQNDALTHDLMNGHIDPQHYVNNMTTGGKIATGIGLILGGMGSGLTHGPNLAFQYLQNQIDRDVDAQKAEIGKKNNLLSHNIQMMGNVRAGIEMTRMQQYKIVQSQLAAEAAKAASPIAAANAQIVNSQLDGKIAEISRQGALYNMMGSGGDAGGEPQFQQKMQVLRMLGNDSMAKELESKHVPGVGQASKDVPADVMKELISRQDLHNKITDLQSFASKNSGSLNPSTVAQGKAKAALVQDAYRRANAQGVFKEAEKNFVGSIVNSDPTQFFEKYRAGKGYQEMGRDNLSSLNTLKQGYGLPTHEEHAQAEPQYKMVKGVKYMRGPNGEAVRVN